MKGWRRKLFGETALEIRAGRSAIGLKNGRSAIFPLAGEQAKRSAAAE
jgi:hypothetical protein